MRRPSGTTAIFVRCFGSRPIGASIRPTAAETLPWTSAWYVFFTRRALSWAMIEAWAESRRATISSPLVSRSRRCTMPGRWTPAIPPQAVPSACARSALTSVSPL